MSFSKRLFLIDGMAQIYRAHFAMIKNPLTTKDGRHTSAIFGFMNFLFKLIKEEKPDYLAIVLDSKENLRRNELIKKINHDLENQLGLKILKYA